MARVFISYRRADRDIGPISGRVYQRLCERFGKQSIFKDVDNIPVGVNFRDVINRAVVRSDVLLVLIGDDWLDCRDSAGVRRLDKEDDYPRLEIEAAFRGGIPIIPLLVGSASMPLPADLPSSLRDLSYRNAMTIQPGPRFDREMDRLIEEIERMRPPLDGYGPTKLTPALPFRFRGKKRLLMGVGAGVAFAAVLLTASPGLRASLIHVVHKPPKGGFFVSETLGSVEGRAQAAISVRLSEPVDPLTATTRIVHLVDSTGSPVAIDVRSEGNRLEIRPARDLAAGSVYRLVIDPALRSSTREPIVTAMGSDREGASMPFETTKPPPPISSPPALAATLSTPARPKVDQPTTGILDVLSNTERAHVEIELDGRPFGVPPVRGIKVEAGKPHQLIFRGTHPASGFDVILLEESITVTGGGRKEFKEEIPPFGSVTVTCVPSGHVFIDGIDTNRMTPLAGWLLRSGRHHLRIDPVGDEEHAYKPIIRDFDLPDWNFKYILGPYSFSMPPSGD